MADQRLTREQAAQVREIVAEAQSAAQRLRDEFGERQIQSAIDRAVGKVDAKVENLTVEQKRQWQKILDVDEVTSEAYDKFPRNTETRNLAEEGHIHRNVRAGGGTDCMATHVTSDCWDGPEGFEVSNATGCTFKIYPTIQGSVDDAVANNAADAGMAIYICGGDYPEEVLLPSNTDNAIDFYGAGRGRTRWGPEAGGSGNALEIDGGHISSEQYTFHGITFRGQEGFYSLLGTASDVHAMFFDCEFEQKVEMDCTHSSFIECDLIKGFHIASGMTPDNLAFVGGKIGGTMVWASGNILNGIYFYGVNFESGTGTITWTGSGVGNNIVFVGGRAATGTFFTINVSNGVAHPSFVNFGFGAPGSNGAIYVQDHGAGAGDVPCIRVTGSYFPVSSTNPYIKCADSAQLNIIGNHMEDNGSVDITGIIAAGSVIGPNTPSDTNVQVDSGSGLFTYYGNGTISGTDAVDAMHGKIQNGAGVPSHTSNFGQLYADSTNDDLYMNTDGSTGWQLIGGPSGLPAHLADTSDAHDASAISILDTANDFTADNVEDALAELQSDAEAHLADTTDAHDASAVSIVDAGGYFTGTEVEAALQELGAGGGGGHEIRENGSAQTARTGLNIVDTDAGAGLVTDDAGNDETEVNLQLYALKSGRAGGQTLKGGLNSGDDLTLESTNHATKGHIIVPDGTAFALANHTTSPSAGSGVTIWPELVAATGFPYAYSSLGASGGKLPMMGGPLGFAFAKGQAGKVMPYEGGHDGDGLLRGGRAETVTTLTDGALDTTYGAYARFAGAASVGSEAGVQYGSAGSGLLARNVLTFAQVRARINVLTDIRAFAGLSSAALSSMISSENPAVTFGASYVGLQYVTGGVAYDPAATLTVNIPSADAAYATAVTLAEDLDASETGVDINDGTSVENNDMILVDSELMKVTAGGGTAGAVTLTVIRGRVGTTAATHTNGTAVVQSGTAFVYTSTGDPVQPNDVIRIDSERLSVTTRDTTNNILLVTRAFGGTSAATHAAAAAITRDDAELWVAYANGTAQTRTRLSGHTPTTNPYTLFLGYPTTGVLFYAVFDGAFAQIQGGLLSAGSGPATTTRLHPVIGVEAQAASIKSIDLFGINVVNNI